jgi:hypothetical protein
MSWQSYVDDHLMGQFDGQCLSSAAIIGLDGGVWAQSASFPQVNLYFMVFHLANIKHSAILNLGLN